jgi:hypothetical protein
MNWPVSIVGADGETAPATKTGFTVTMSSGEHRETGEDAESVTL